MARDDAEWMLPWVSLIHAGTYLAAALDRRLQEQLGISLPEQDLLSQLSKLGGELRMVDLARRVQFSKAGLTKLIDRLEEGGLVERVALRSDRRAKSARLTAEGRKLLTRSRTVLRSFVAENFRDHLPAERIADLGRTLQQLLEAHGRWHGQLAHVRGDRYPDDGSDGGSAETE